MLVELDVGRNRQNSQEELNRLVEEKVTKIREELAQEMQRELAKHKQAALKVLKAQQQKLNNQFKAKQQNLVENSKKLVALANKISQQKAEVEAARKSLRDALDNAST